jgi:hypothetical protein
VQSHVVAENPAQQPTKHVKEERGGLLIIKSGKVLKQSSQTDFSSFQQQYGLAIKSFENRIIELNDENMVRRDVFISHASEDKQTYVYPLAKAFDSLGITYWLDEAEIKWGDSIINKLHDGLTNSRYVLVLLSEKFINRPWTKKELNIALSQEIDSEKVIVLPVLITQREIILEKIPLIRDKLYLEYENNPLNIAYSLLKLLGREYKTEWIHIYDKSYTGKVWIRVSKPSLSNNIEYKYNINWGSWEYNGSLDFKSFSCISLWCTKGNDDIPIPIIFKIKPECYVTFGIGNVPNNEAIDINRGWKLKEFSFFKNFIQKFIRKNNP